ncbi:hypothetical protein EBF16_11530 [Sphingobium yanoikuyae]|uniref:Uncharacterized protein n=1 Tax=Sphingobium yanoikuyae TaxID=13690 RepID=A0A3G2UQH0_SPHYA|nr:hypothetical protein EBF16_11530 [Sphingobium yanoikuyae]
MSAFGRFQTILPCKGRWLAAGQTEGCRPLDRATPLHHFVVPLPLQGRNLPPLLVVRYHRKSVSHARRACPILLNPDLLGP